MQKLRESIKAEIIFTEKFIRNASTVLIRHGLQATINLIIEALKLLSF